MENLVVLKKCRSGLGMKICGGQVADGTFTGIFVKKILIGGAVASDGTLKEGDELLAANGEGLKNCTNDQAVLVLRNAAQCGTVKISFRRDDDSRERFEKLFPTLNDEFYAKLRQQSLDNGGLSRSDSMSSRVSTTSLEKRAWVYTGQRMSPAPWKESQTYENGGPVANHDPTRMEALDLPLGPTERDHQSTENGISSSHHPSSSKRKDVGTELDRASSFDSGFPSSGRFSSPDLTEKGIVDSMPVIKIDIPANTNLGISINGGKNKPDGPHIYVKEVIEGCDAYLDGRIRKGDRIVSINGESFIDVTYEQARSLLLRLKLQKHLSKYTIQYVVHPERTGSSRMRSMVPPLTSDLTIQKTPEESLLVAEDQNLFQDSSPNNIESVVSHSSDEEAVIKELMKMMERSDDYEMRLTKDYPSMLSGDLSKSREDFTSSEALPDRFSQQYNTIREDLEFDSEMSPGTNGALFNPGKFSSPEVANGELDHYEQTPASVERKTISQYLEEDMNDTYSPNMTSPLSSRMGQTKQRRGRRLSLDPTTKIKVEKLEVAMNYLGFEATPSKMREVRRRVRVDHNGSVTYGDFVEAAREVFDLRLDDRTRTLNASALQFAVRDIETMEKPARKRNQKKHPVFEPQQQQQQQHQHHYLQEHQPQQQSLPQSLSNGTARLTIKDIEAIEQEESKIVAQREAGIFAEMQGANRRIQDDLARVSRERDDALRELQYFKRQLNEKNNNTSDIEDQLNKSRQEIASAYREVGELRTRTHLVSTALQEAKQREQQYEQKIEILKGELEGGKSQVTNNGPKQREFNELQKRLVVLGCQLRKTEVSKRTYEVAVEKLTKFVERVHDTADGQKTPTQGRRNSTNKGRSPNIENLAQEARDTVRAVKLLLEEEPLPFGWEEVYAPDGTRYYINHVTQTTSWLHPVSGVQHTGSSQNGIEGPPTDQQF